MARHRVQVGLHGRNDVQFSEPDYALVRQARIETIKMMSFTDVSVYQRLRQEQPDIEFIVRLYDDRLNRNSRPSPGEFVAKMVPIIKHLKPYASKFEIHNEPNHVDGIEGWGASDENARAFRSWYMQVLPALKKACPWANFGFPGLALHHPHRDLEWLEICRDAIGASDWLGCHCYWQFDNMLSQQWGLRFKLYHKRFPKKRIEITEFGDSTPNLSPDRIAGQYVQYYQELSKYPYLGSASAFIASSPDPTWAPFVWMRDGGEMLPVVDAVSRMPRKAVEVPEPAPPKPKPGPQPRPPVGPSRSFPQTGKTVRGGFLQFFDQYGLDICGYPITGQIEESGLPSQYFQRLGLEEFKPGKIRLKPVGSEALASREKIAKLELRIQKLRERSLAGGGPAQPDLTDVVDKLPKHASKQFPSRSLIDIEQIIIHHSATGATVTPQGMAQYQVLTLDKPGVTYHFFIAANGAVYQTNRLETLTDHARDQSAGSVGVVFAGDFSEGIPSAAQLQAGGQLCAWLLDHLRLPSDRVVGLSEIASTQSPGIQWLRGKRWKDRLLAEIEAVLEKDGEDQPRRQSTATGSHAVSQPTIQDLVDELAKHETKRYNTRSRSEIQTLVIHHSAVPARIGPKSIANYHVARLDWPAIGYHFVVSADGVIHQTNTLETVSSHAAKVNPRSVGICFLGNFNAEIPPPVQLQAGAHLAAWLMQELGVALDDVKGHQEFMDTACPGNQWLRGQNWKQMLHQEIVKA